MANHRCFDIEPPSFLAFEKNKIKVLELPTLRRHMLHLYALHRKGMCCTWTCLHYKGLCCTWTCLHHRGRSCTLTCLHCRGLSNFWRCLHFRGLSCIWTCLVYATEASAAHGRVYTTRSRSCTWTCLHYKGLCSCVGVFTTGAWAVSVRVYTSVAFAECAQKNCLRMLSVR